MRYFCPGCGSKYTKPAEEIPAEGMTIRCPKCTFKISIKPPREAEAAPPPVAASPEKKPASKPSADPPTVLKEQLEAPKDAALDEDEETMDQAFGEEQTDVEEIVAPTPSSQAKSKSKPKAKDCPFLSSLGTGKSGSEFRFRDLFCALSVSLDYRKLLLAASAIFLGNLLYAGIMALARLAGNATVETIGGILGLAVFWALVFLGLGATAYQSYREMSKGKILPLGEGVTYLKARPFSVLALPLWVLGAVLLLGAAMAVLAVIGRIPYAGPLLYGLSFSISFALSLLAVLCCLFLMLASFSYIPLVAEEKLAGRAGARGILNLIWRQPGRYLAHFLLVCLTVFALLWLLQVLASLALMGVLWVGGKAMGPDLGPVFLSIPGALFPVAQGWLPAPLMAMLAGAGGAGWQFSIAGWLVGLAVLYLFSMVFAAGLVYFGAAGVVNYQLLRRRENRKEKK